MGRVNTPALTTGQRIELELGFREGSCHSFRMRCHSILLKSEGRISKDVGVIVGMRKLKKEWLNPEDYLSKDELFYATNRCLANVGINLKIKFADFNSS
jgi:hypothetical protein